MLLVTIPALIYTDRMCRRTSMIVGGLLLTLCMLIIGSLYASSSVHAYGSARWVVVVSIFAFALTYCSTWAASGKLFAAEIQPLRQRAAANCVATGLGFVRFTVSSFALAMLEGVCRPG